MQTLLRLLMIIGILGMNSMRDMREKKIYVLPTIVAGAFGAAMRIGMGIRYASSLSSYWIAALLMACIPGMILICLAAFTEQKIGYGDGITAWAVGMWASFESTLSALLLGMLFVCAASMFCRIQKKKILEWPFIPFFAAGMLLVMLCRGI